MSESTERLEQRLKKIRQQVDDTDRFPVPTLEIIGEEQREAHWQSLLVYFLEKDNPHGFGTDVLAAFLEAIKSHPETNFESGSYDINEVDIESEVPTGNGPVDLLLTLDDKWFICIELKVRSPETGDQTVRYATAGTIGDLVVSEFDDTGHYLYLAPENAPEPSSENFVAISWRNVVARLEDVLREGHGQYPAKSTAQLADYLDTIKRELNMSDVDEISKETELYIEHHEIVDQLKEAYEEDKKELFRKLKRAFFTESNVDPKNWEVNNRPSRYINFYKGPWQNLECGTSIEYEPHIHLKRDHPRIRLRLDIEHGDKHALREEFRNQLGEERLQELKADDWEVIDGSYGYLAKSIPIDFEAPNESVRYAARELHQLREIVEPHIETVVANHQPD